ncbi:MAG: T9SS type A sorting domain-containing protein [Crocinitomicaceae bacterium]
MYKSIFLSFFVLLLTTSFAQTEYYSGFDSPSENAGWTQIKKGDMGTYEWVLDASSSVSPDSCLAHYYPVGGSIPTDDWYVSPLFDFSAGGWIDTLWNNYNGFGTPMAGDTIQLCLLNGSSDPDLANVTVLYSFSDSTYMADNTWRELLMIPVGTHAGDSYLAFRYYTTNNWLDVKFDNLKVTSFSTASISKNDLNANISVFPNPATDQLNLSLTEDVLETIQTITIYNSVGQLEETLSSTSKQINLSSYTPGIYFIQINTDNAEITKKFVITK